VQRQDRCVGGRFSQAIPNKRLIEPARLFRSNRSNDIDCGRNCSTPKGWRWESIDDEATAGLESRPVFAPIAAGGFSVFHEWS